MSYEVPYEDYSIYGTYKVIYEDDCIYEDYSIYGTWSLYDPDLEILNIKTVKYGNQAN